LILCTYFQHDVHFNIISHSMLIFSTLCSFDIMSQALWPSMFTPIRHECPFDVTSFRYSAFSSFNVLSFDAQSKNLKNNHVNQRNNKKVKKKSVGGFFPSHCPEKLPAILGFYIVRDNFSLVFYIRSMLNKQGRGGSLLYF
jgi:hypothetical protein